MSLHDNIRLQIEYLPTDDLKSNPKNPRLHGKQQISLITQSVGTSGFNKPILIDRAGNVIAGHAILLAAKRLGLKRIPTIRLDHLTEQQAKAFAIADNRLSELSTWDDRLLAQTLKDISTLDLDLSIEATGFTMAEIDVLIESLSDDAQSSNTEDDLPSFTDRAPISRKSDLWILGNHRLLCGDALADASYHALMGDALAAMVFTDPPWNLKVDGHISGSGRIHHREFAFASGEMSNDQFLAFLRHSCSTLARHSKDGAIHFICIGWGQVRELLEAGRESFSELKNICAWVKHNAGLGSFYRSQHELICVFKNGRARHCNNIRLGEFGRNRSNVWQYPGANNFGRGTEEGNLLEHHPTPKPLQLVADAILDCSNRGDIILDSFLGSGTTIIAAERTGRRCYGIEIDPHYSDFVIRRWQKYTGQDAIRAADNRNFSDIEAEIVGAQK
jgi:DNA modification methylase